MATYAIRGGDEGKRRLDLLAQTMAPTTRALLTDVGVSPGGACIDVGCGGGHVSRLLAELVTPAGRVVGLDFDPVKIAAAKAEASRAGLNAIDFRTGDVSDWSEPETYDLVYGRFILSHLTGRDGIVRRMAEALRPGGALVLEDIDFDGSFSHPPNSAFHRYCELYDAVIARRGGDAKLGPKMPSLLVDAGLTDVRVSVVQPVHTGNEPGKGMALSTLVNISEAVVAEGLATVDELAEHVGALAAYTDDTRSIMSLPRVFQVRGRKV